MSLDSYGAASMGALVQEAPRPGVFTDGDHIVADDGYEPVDYLSVGEVADLLGVAPATLRSWGRRYGLVPAARTEGGHRRYTPDEVDRLRRMQELVGCGVMPAAAARQVLSEAATQPGRTDGSGAVVPVRLRALPGSRPLAVAGASADARALARAVSRLDVEAAGGQVRDMLVRRGAEVTWAGVVSPVLRAIAAARRRDGSEGVEGALAEAVTQAVRGYCGFLPAPGRDRPILLAGAPDETRTLPLHIMRAALAERRVGSVLLGAVPAEVVSFEARRVGARQVLVWREAAAGRGAWASGVVAPSVDGLDPSEARLLPPDLPRPLVVGGDGWAGVRLPAGLHWVPDLRSAVRALSAPKDGVGYRVHRTPAPLGRLA